MVEKILIIDDDVDTLKLVGMMLQKQGYMIIASANGKQGLAQAEAENPDFNFIGRDAPRDGRLPGRQTSAGKSRDCRYPHPNVFCQDTA